MNSLLLFINIHNAAAGINNLNNNLKAATASRLPPIWLLVLCSAIGPVSMTMTQPATSAVMRSFSADYGVAQLVVTIYLIASAFSALILGPLSDRFGRRWVMQGGLSLFALGSLICIVSPSLEWLLAGRFIQGCGGVVGVTLSRAIVRDVHSLDKSASVIGYITMAMVLAPMVGPVLGGLVTEWWSWRLIFVIMFVYTVTLLLLVYRFQNETRIHRGTGGALLFSGLPILLSSRRFLGYLITIAFASGVFFSFVGGAPFVVMEVMGASPSEYGMYFVLTGLGYMLGNFLTGRFSQRIGAHRMVVASLLPLFAGILLVWILSSWLHPLSLYIPMFILALSNGLAIPNATAAGLSIRPDIAGTASGITGFLQVGVGALMSAIGGFTQDGTVYPMIYLLTVCAVVSALGVYLAAYGKGSQSSVS